MNLLKNAKWKIGEEIETPFVNKYYIYQDGTTPMYRDGEGTMWAISGHTHAGHIGMFKGTHLGDMREVYPIHTNFQTGAAGAAFDCIKYPEGVLPRGSIWPFGLYICPKTNRFFSFFHNETGWNGHGTGYIISGPGTGEPDFRHIGLMHSDDCGKTWDFDRWVITAEDVCYSTLYRPDGIKTGGQEGELTNLGAGDFTIFVEPDGEYIYIFYNMMTWEGAEPTTTTKGCRSCDVFVARTRQRDDGTMGDFVKFYNGEFCEAGNLGKESAVARGAWHPRVIYSKSLDAYIMSAQKIDIGKEESFTKMLSLRTGKSLTDWSEDLVIDPVKEKFHHHYYACLANDKATPHNVIDNKCTVMCGGNGSDVIRYDVEFNV